MSFEKKLKEKLMNEINTLSKSDLKVFIDDLLENLFKEEKFIEKILDRVDISITKQTETPQKPNKKIQEPSTLIKEKVPKKEPNIKSDDYIAKAISEELKNVPDVGSEENRDSEPLQPIDLETLKPQKEDKIKDDTPEQQKELDRMLEV